LVLIVSPLAIWPYLISSIKIGNLNQRLVKQITAREPATSWCENDVPLQFRREILLRPDFN